MNSEKSFRNTLKNIFHFSLFIFHFSLFTYLYRPQDRALTLSKAHVYKPPPQIGGSRASQIEVRARSARSSTRKTLGDQGDFLKILSQVSTPKPNARSASTKKKGRQNPPSIKSKFYVPRAKGQNFGGVFVHV